MGYDVWMGNSRGNKHSRKHVKYNPDKDRMFWEFTFQHMADEDLPAMFTYVNKITNQKYVWEERGFGGFLIKTHILVYGISLICK